VSALPGSPESESFRMPPDSDSEATRAAGWQATPFRGNTEEPVDRLGRFEFGAQGAGSSFSPGGRADLAAGDWPGHQAWGEAASAIFQPLAGGGGLVSGDHESGFGIPGTADLSPGPAVGTAAVEIEQAATNLNRLGSLKPMGQLRDSFILATGEDGLWIIDQHVAHERILFEKILRERQTESVQRQRLLMPLLVELKPWQMVVFARIADELGRNGIEVEPFGPQQLAVKAAPPGLEGAALERMLTELIEKSSSESGETFQNENLAALRARIAASMACHAAIKVNCPLDVQRMEWLLSELAKTSHPTNCPHGRPIALLYSWKEIQRAFHRI
jgi:DNA mismatch repair protein MutL